MIRAELVGADRMKLVLTAELGRLRDLSAPLRAIGYLERDLAVERIRKGGDPPWPPSKKTLPQTFSAPASGNVGRLSFERGETIARGGYGQTGIDEGTMLRALESPDAVRLQGTTAVTVSVNVRSRDGRYNYAQIFQSGSGAFAGRSAWTIQGNPVLAWSVGGVTFFARRVTIQGQPPRPFLYPQGSEDKVRAILRQWLIEPLKGR